MGLRVARNSMENGSGSAWHLPSVPVQSKSLAKLVFSAMKLEEVTTRGETCMVRVPGNASFLALLSAPAAPTKDFGRQPACCWKLNL